MGIDSQASIVVGTMCIVAFFFLLIPGEQVGITKFDNAHGNALLVQDGTMQTLIGIGSNEVIISELARHMSWFDKRIELIVIPTLSVEDMGGASALFDQYDVGVFILPHANTINAPAKVFIDQLLRRHIPYRFAQYGEIAQAGSITMRIIAPIDTGDTTVVRIDMPGGSLVVSGGADNKLEQQLLSRVPRNAFFASLVDVEQHGTKQRALSSLFFAAISPQLSLSDTSHEISVTSYAGKWFMKCYNETDLPFLQKFCMHK